MTSTIIIITTTDVDSPVGTIRIAVREAVDPSVGPSVVVACCFADHWDRTVPRVEARFPGATWTTGDSEAARALRRYIDGDLHALDDLAIDVGGTAFQQRVWKALRTIPLGETWSYSALAAATGAASATRAVGTANGANPVWLVVPCHRVIRSDGSLGGYGGGLDRKAWLLQHEGVASGR